MAYREVLVTQVIEVLRAWLGGAGKRPAAARAGVDVKTAARYIAAARQAGLSREGGPEQLTDELLGRVIGAVRPSRPAGHGPSWQLLEARKEEIAGWVGQDLTLVKIGEKLERSGTAVPYRTLARFAAAECGYQSRGPKVTVPVEDGDPGRELQVDFGYLGLIPDGDRRRRVYGLVFTAVYSRYCYVHLSYRQTTEAVIAGCEAAWAFFGGIFPVLIPDNLKPVVDKANRVDPTWNREWLEYAQVRGIVADPARVRSPQDKGRVENGVKFAQRSFFAGEEFLGLEDAQRRAAEWCRVRAGLRIHGTTRRQPAVVFAAQEAPLLAPPPQRPYQIPYWGEFTVHRDFQIRVQYASYTVPYQLVGQRVTARADESLVKVYHRGQVITTHPRQPRGGHSRYREHYPPGTDVLARRDVASLLRQAYWHGEPVGMYAGRVLDTDLPWNRMRAVYALIGLCKTHGDEKVGQACAAALELDVISVAKIRSIVEKGTQAEAARLAEQARKASAAGRRVRQARAARFARDPAEFAAGPAGTSGAPGDGAGAGQEALPGLDDLGGHGQAAS